ncbi:MAG: J domain-containing protein [bacterium]
MKKLFPYVLVSLFIFAGVSMHGYVYAADYSPIISSASSVMAPVVSELVHDKSTDVFVRNKSIERSIEGAEKIVNAISCDELIAENAKIDDLFKNRFTKRFGINWPLVEVRNQLDLFMGSLKTTQARLVNEQKKISSNLGYSGYAVKSDALLKKIANLTALIDKRKASVLKNPAFSGQVKLYDSQRLFKRNLGIGLRFAVVAFVYIYRFISSYDWQDFNGDSDNHDGGNFGGSLGEIQQCRKVLGVTADATRKDLQKALRKLMLEFHPDRCGKNNPNPAHCNARAIEINACYELLNPKSKSTRS